MPAYTQFGRAWRVADRHILRGVLLNGLAAASVLFTSHALFAETTTAELSPLISKSTLVAPLGANKQIGVALALPSSDPGGLAAFVKHVSTPGDPLFRQYITADQFAQRFGGSAADYQAVKGWAVANGLVVSQESIGRTLIVVRGSASIFQRLFQTQLNTYRASDGQTFYSASVQPIVPAQIASKISGVIGLTAGKSLAPYALVAKQLGENPALHSARMHPDSAGGTGPGGTYSCDDLRRLYQIPDWGNLDKGVVVGVFEQGSYATSDVDVYFKKFNIGKNTKQTLISVDGSPIAFEEAVEDEACLDIDMFVGMNPYIAEVKVYIDDYLYDPFPVAMVAAFHAIADDKDQPTIISVSYGEIENVFGVNAEAAEDTVLQELAVQGITVLASSGDEGAYGEEFLVSYNVPCPASDPYITGVGGTSLYTQPDGAYIVEDAWNHLGDYLGATGGGISAYWSAPDYQSPSLFGGIDNEYMTEDGGSWTQRNVPDVAAVGDPLTGVGIYVKDQGGWLQIGGTSVSAPVWAGYLSNINAAAHWSGVGNIGFFNPFFYSLGTGLSPYYYAWPVNYALPVTDGSNGDLILYGSPGYTNGTVYNNTTGNGTIWGGGVGLYALISGSQPGTAPGAFTSATPKLRPTTCDLSWSQASGASAYVMYVKQIFSPNYQVFLLSNKASSFTITGLTPYTDYFINLYAFNRSGNSEDTSSPVIFETP
jgi:subtilase family serine protease